jgi:hypothetical protein
MAAGTAAVATENTDTCPVCAVAVPVLDPDDDVTCPRCGLIVHTGLRLGPVTEELRRRLDGRQQAAMRGLDALAALRAAGHPGPEDRVRLLRLARLAGDPPLTEAELDRARSLATGSPASTVPSCHDPRQAALSALTGGNAAEVRVVLVDRHGLALRVFAGGDDPRVSREDGLIEHAVADRWTWLQMLADVPAEEDTRLFWLAGRAGPAGPRPGIVAEAARSWVEQQASGWPAAAVIRRDPGWAVPDGFASSLTGLLAARTGRAVPDLELAPEAPPQDWSASVPARGSAWGMAPGYPEPEQVTVAVGTAEGNVAVVRAGADTEPRIVLRLQTLVTAAAPAATAPGGGILAGSVLGEVRWVPGPGLDPVSLPNHSGRVSAVASGTRMLLSLGSEGRLHRVRLGGGGPDLSAWDMVELGSSGASVLAVAERAAVAVTGGADGILRVLDTESLNHREVRLGVWITALALDPEGRLAVAGHGDGGVAVIRLGDGASRRLFAVPDPPAGPLALSLDGDGATVVAADAAGLLTAWSGGLFGGEGTTTRLGRHVGGVGAVRHLGPARVLAVGRRDAVLRAWFIPGPNRRDRPTTGEV